MQTTDFLISQIDRQLADRLHTIGAREFEEDYKNKNFKQYEYNLSYSRALARISDYSGKQYFQGSSLLRKKKQKDNAPGVSDAPETFDEPINESPREKTLNVLRNVKKLHKSKHVDDKGLSRRTRLKITEKMLAIYAASPKKFTLQTLTMIAPATDTNAVKCLNKYLTVLRKKGAFNYIWVAEKQTNGNIHFHMVCDKKFKIAEINSLWIIQQIKSGIVNHKSAQKLMLDYGVTFYDVHNSGFYGIAQQYLNPVDVANVNTMEYLSAYLTKYITKNETKLSCAMWHCSRNVSRLFTKQLISKKIFAESSNGAINKYYNKKKNRTYENKTFVHQYGLINTIYNKKHFKKYLGEMEALNSWILDNIAIDTGVKVEYDRFTEILYGFDPKTGECETQSINDYKTKSQLINFKNQKNEQKSSLSRISIGSN